MLSFKMAQQLQIVLKPSYGSVVTENTLSYFSEDT